MNYFRCTVGGSGNKLKLTVTCDSGFAGATISCTDGTTTLTATCPSSSPYTVIFKIPNAGTWTISSGSDSTTVVISDTATLHQIPTGSTATPVNVIQTWLHCANIWNKSYTTINQVLADTSTLLALISSNNAADYMARSTNWASSVCANQTAMGYIGNNDYCANKLLANSTWLNAICNSTYMESVLNVKVPIMTSNTTPYGVAASNPANFESYYPWLAFNGNKAQINGCALNSTTGKIYYKFTNPIKVKRLDIYKYGSGPSVGDLTYRVCYSDDGSTWRYDSVSRICHEQTDETEKISADLGYHLYWGVDVTGTTGMMVLVCSLQFYGRA